MLILGFALLIILFGMSLILPVMLVRKWQAHPVLALLSAALLCGITYALLFGLMDLSVNGLGGTDSTVWTGLGVIAFILGLPILIIFQWRNRRKQKGLTQKTIEETF